MIDVHSGTWRALAKELAGEIATARDELERFGTEPAKADWLRGRIALANEILAIPQRAPEEE